jgi:hypothetical protein
MSAVPFDTLKYAEALKAAGVPDPQARAQAEALAEALRQGGQGFATKVDIADLRTEMAGIRGALTLVQWMLGFNLALSVAMALTAIGPHLAKFFAR